MLGENDPGRAVFISFSPSCLPCTNTELAESDPMKTPIEQRVLTVADYATVRATAEGYGVGKSTIISKIEADKTQENSSMCTKGF